MTTEQRIEKALAALADADFEGEHEDGFDGAREILRTLVRETLETASKECYPAEEPLPWVGAWRRICALIPEAKP